MYSELISAAIASGGPHAAKTSAVKLMRSVKKVALRLIEVRLFWILALCPNTL